MAVELVYLHPYQVPQGSIYLQCRMTAVGIPTHRLWHRILGSMLLKLVVSRLILVDNNNI